MDDVPAKTDEDKHEDDDEDYKADDGDTVEQQVEGVPGPHPTTRHRSPGHHCPLRPCRCATAHPQCEHLATRASGACGQGVGAPSPLSKSCCLKIEELKRSFPRAGREENIVQLDGNTSISNESRSETNEDESTSKDEEIIENEVTEDEDDDDESESEENSEESDYDTEDEVDSEPIRPVLIENREVPGQLEVDISGNVEVPTSLPLCLCLNARSVYNKKSNLKNILNTIAPCITIISESWERRAGVKKCP